MPWAQELGTGIFNTVGQDRPEPFKLWDQQLKSLQDAYKKREQTLRGYKMHPQQHNKYLMQLQAAYDKEKSELLATQNQLKSIQRGIDAGDFSTVNGMRAMYSLLLTPSVAGAMYPAPKKETTEAPFSPGQIGTYEKFLGKYIGATALTGIPYGSYQKMMHNYFDQYMKARQDAGYDSMPPTRQKQFDSTWDNLMKVEAKDQWDVSTPGIQAVRTYGNKMQGLMARKISPLSRGVMVEKPKEQVQERRPASKYSLGQKVERGGRTFVITSFDTDGEPLVEEVK